MFSAAVIRFPPNRQDTQSLPPPAPRTSLYTAKICTWHEGMRRHTYGPHQNHKEVVAVKAGEILWFLFNFKEHVLCDDWSHYQLLLSLILTQCCWEPKTIFSALSTKAEIHSFSYVVLCWGQKSQSMDIQYNDRSVPIYVDFIGNPNTFQLPPSID